MHEFMEIAKQTRLMAMATQSELVNQHGHIKRFEKMLEQEREARVRLEVTLFACPHSERGQTEFATSVADSRRTINLLREEIAAMSTIIHQLSSRDPLPVNAYVSFIIWG